MAAALLGLSAAWTASGAVGLMGDPLRRGLVWTLVVAAAVVAWPRPSRRYGGFLALGAGVLLAVAVVALREWPAAVLAIGLVLAVLALGHKGAGRVALRLTAQAVVLLGLYRLAVTSIPAVWLAADTFGGGLGRLAGTAARQPLWVGATFAGLDFLVTSLVLAALVAWRMRDSGRPFFVGFLAVGAASILLVHVGYLAALAHTAPLPGRMAEQEVSEPASPSEVPAEDRTAATLKVLVPWNFPAIAAVLHLGVSAALLLCLLRLRRAAEAGAAAAADAAVSGSRPEASPAEAGACRPRRFGPALLLSGGLLAALLPAVTTLCPQRPELEGKRIVVFEEGFLNWLRPEHGDYGRLAIGMYGMLPTYIESLGAECLVSPELSEADLHGADALILIYPNNPWKDGQLERILDFVRRGGTLLVLGEHTVREEGGGARFNDVLEAGNLAMRVRFDSATFAVGGWLNSYETVAHPTTAGLADDRNLFGSVIGASVAARWPARPWLIGRWGWADPGDPGAGTSMMGNHRYDPGEKLGDLVLAAEQPLGRGRVVVFGDTSAMTNGLTIGCHPYTSRLLAYLVAPGSTPHAMWRQAAGIVAALLLAGWILGQPAEGRLALIAAAAAVSLAASTSLTAHAWKVLPDGRVKSPNKLAYIDASHSELYSGESWRSEGTMGLSLTLMRNGYLTLLLPEFTEERLARARLLVSIAPQRPFTAKEQRILRDFIESGGIFICTVGYLRAGPSREMLDELGFRIGGAPNMWAPGLTEPKPLGHFKSPFFDGGDYNCYVRYHAGWPVGPRLEQALVVSRYPGELPLIVVRRIGRGLVAVVGDTCFAMNVNLEREDGLPFEGLRENADFWRWFLALLADGEMWYPPNPEAAP